MEDFDSCTSNDKPPMKTRKDWHARPPKDVQYLQEPVLYTFIHHTVDPESCKTTAECIKAVQAIQKYHMDDRGWSDIGYSFLIGEDGLVYEGRGWGVVGAHTKGYNDVGFGISFIGDFMDRVPDDAAVKVAKQLIAYGVSQRHIREDYLLRGHRDVEKTLCPGDALYKLIQTWGHK